LGHLVLDHVRKFKIDFSQLDLALVRHYLEKAVADAAVKRRTLGK
jgi:hypothetical protein